MERIAGYVGQAGAAPNIDFPQAGEKVAPGHYAIRISGCQGECQAAIDDGEWQACRTEDGYCWYDWSPQAAGRHRIQVRARNGNKWLKTQRTCEVK
jgi:hypothetical protein